MIKQSSGQNLDGKTFHPQNDYARCLTPLLDSLGWKGSDRNLTEALPHLEEAAELRPDLADPWVTMGECYLRWGRHAEAVEYLEKARDMKPEDGGIVLRLGMAYEAARMPEEALEAYEEAVRRSPSSYEARYNLGNAYLGRGDIGRAREQFEKAQAISQGKPHAVFLSHCSR